VQLIVLDVQLGRSWEQEKTARAQTARWVASALVVVRCAKIVRKDIFTPLENKLSCATLAHQALSVPHKKLQTKRFARNVPRVSFRKDLAREILRRVKNVQLESGLTLLVVITTAFANCAKLENGATLLVRIKTVSANFVQLDSTRASVVRALHVPSVRRVTLRMLKRNKRATFVCLGFFQTRLGLMSSAKSV
jgi:hypothetical protein